MKINRLDAHDRYEHFTNQSFDIAQTCQNIINQRPFGDHAFYIFSHKREIGIDERIAIFNDDLREALTNLTYKRRFQTLSDVPTARIIWQPRLTKPKAQTNSMLFKAYPGTDVVKVIWILPDRELWNDYESGKLTASQAVAESIHDFQHNRDRLEAKEEDDLSDEVIDQIYREISRESRYKKT